MRPTLSNYLLSDYTNAPLGILGDKGDDEVENAYKPINNTGDRERWEERERERERSCITNCHMNWGDLHVTRCFQIALNRIVSALIALGLPASPWHIGSDNAVKRVTVRL